MYWLANRTARLVGSALVLALLGLGAVGVLPAQPALAVCEPCHVPTPPEDNQDVDPIDWSLYDGIERDDSSDADHPDSCLDHEQQMCVADDGSSNGENNMCSVEDAASHEDDDTSSEDNNMSSEDDNMSSADDYMCVAR